ncbi:MAG: T9SS C-terminal target domain-containing protein [Sphingobacteriales bacterium]|nr:MAG: T9SS C-terminal target domain-containing protein [Sphingobacteriales bacterium]
MKYWLFALLLQGIFIGSTSAQVVIGVDTLINNGNKNNRINLVFMGDGYTTAQQSQFISDVNTIVNKLFITPPFNHYTNFFNVYAIKVVSVESGADHAHTAADCGSANPQVPNATVNTMLGAQFDYGGIHRLLYCTNTTNINSILQSYAPFYDKALIVVNSPYYGGSGGTFPTCSVETNSAEIMIHELGHSFAALGDEYGGTSCGGIEKPNCTQETNPTLIKWKSWFPNGITIPTPAGTNCSSIGLYLGANYCNTSWYRPKCNCKMNQLNNPFCEVCSQEFVYCISNSINLIESTTPTNSSITLSNGQSQVFTTSVVLPIPNSLFITWKIDNVVGSINTTSYTILGTNLSTGTHTLILTVSDTSSLSKKQMAQYTTIWTITKTGTIVTLNPFNPVCSNATEFLLTGGSPSGGTYSGPGVTSGYFYPSQAGTGIHTITYTYSGSLAAQPLTVNAQPNVNVSNNATICVGSSANLISSGATTYSWSPSIGLNATVGASVIASPISNQAYTVVGNTNGCTKSQIVFVFVNSLPTVSVTGASSICKGSNTVLTASGALTYSWSPSTDLNSTTGACVTALPTITTSYTITGNNNGCTAMATKILSVKTTPVISATSTPTSCPFSSDGLIDVSISPSGQTLFYSWSNGTTTQDLQNVLAGNYSVSVSNSSGCSAIKNNSITAPACNVVSGISITNVNSSSAVVNWNANSCASFIKLRRKATTETIWKYSELDGTLVSKSLSNLQSGKTYEVQVMSYCNSSKTDSSGYSSSYYFTTSNTCTVPTRLFTTTIFSTSATLSWNANNNSFYNKLRYRVTNGTWHFVNVSGGLNQYTLNNLLPNTTYQWVLKSVCDSSGIDFSSFTGSQYFTTSSVVRKEENESNSLYYWKIYPNPTSDKINVSNNFSSEGKTILIVSDVMGKEMFRKTFTESTSLNTELDLSDYTEGTYLLQIQSTEGNYISKISKQ